MGAGIHGLQYSVISAVAVARLCWTGTAFTNEVFCLPSKQMVVLSFSESRSAIMIFIHHSSSFVCCTIYKFNGVTHGHSWPDAV